MEVNDFKSFDRILIIGGTGFIGKHLVKRCLRYGPDVVCISFSSTFDKELKLDNVRVIQSDIKDKEKLRSVLYDESFDYVFNLGGYIDHADYFKGGRKIIDSHFIGLLNLIDSLDVGKLKGFIHVGSSDEYGGIRAPQKETEREMPFSPYSFAKTAASHFIQMIANTEGFPGVVLRLFLVYGPGQDDRRFIPQIIKACLKNERFNTSEGKQLRDFCYVGDVVDAMVRAALSPVAKGHVINIGSGMPISIREVVEKIINLIGGGNPVWGGYPYRKGENMALYADISLSKTLLTWEPKVSLEDGLKNTINYYRKIF